MPVAKQINALARPPLRFALWQWRTLQHHHTVQSAYVSPQAQIGYRAIVRRGVEVGSDVTLGDYSYLSGPRSYLESARIGKFCSIARQTVIGVGDHDHTRVSSHPFSISPAYGNLRNTSKPWKQKPRPVIGNDVWIAINSVVLRGVTIGDGAVVAANSVVTRDVAPYTIVAGAPAKPVKLRFEPAVAEALQRIAWWDWDEKKLREWVDAFEDPETFVERFG